MPEVSTFRLYVLRATYLLLFVGLGIDIAPKVVHHPGPVSHMTGVVWAILATVWLLSILGLRYPVQMIPLLLFELAWKVIWLLAFALPLALAHQVDANIAASVRDTLMGVVLVPLALPWGHVWRNYVVKRSERWR